MSTGKRFLFVVVFGCIVAGCPAKSIPINSLSVLEVQGLLNNDFAVLVDVREDVEVQATGGVIARAKHFPASRAAQDPRAFEIFVGEQLPRDKQVVFYGGETAAGAALAAQTLTREEDRARVRKMAELAQSRGVRAATLNGGFQDWPK